MLPSPYHCPEHSKIIIFMDGGSRNAGGTSLQGRFQFRNNLLGHASHVATILMCRLANRHIQKQWQLRCHPVPLFVFELLPELSNGLGHSAPQWFDILFHHVCIRPSVRCRPRSLKTFKGKTIKSVPEINTTNKGEFLTPGEYHQTNVQCCCLNGA